MKEIRLKVGLCSVSCIFHRITEDKEQLYERLKDILERFPDWRMSAFSNTAEEYLLNPHSTTFAPVAATEEGRALLAANEGIGPIKVAVKVMKRLYDEGKAFLDMDESAWQAIRKILRTCMHKPCRENAPALRVLYKLFPTECEDVKIEIASKLKLIWYFEFKMVLKMIFIFFPILQHPIFVTLNMNSKKPVHLSFLAVTRISLIYWRSLLWMKLTI